MRYLTKILIGCFTSILFVLNNPVLASPQKECAAWTRANHSIGYFKIVSTDDPYITINLRPAIARKNYVQKKRPSQETIVESDVQEHNKGYLAIGKNRGEEGTLIDATPVSLIINRKGLFLVNNGANHKCALAAILRKSSYSNETYFKQQLANKEKPPYIFTRYEAVLIALRHLSAEALAKTAICRTNPSLQGCPSIQKPPLALPQICKELKELKNNREGIISSQVGLGIMSDAGQLLHVTARLPSASGEVKPLWEFELENQHYSEIALSDPRTKNKSISIIMTNGYAFNKKDCLEQN